MALTTNLVRYYRLNENVANTTVTDATGTTNGTASENTSGLYSSSDHINGCFAFDGTSENVSLGNSSTLNTASFTIGMWIYKTADTAANRYPFSRFSSGGHGAYFTRILADETLQFLWNVGGLSNESITSTGTIPLNTWTAIMVTYTSGTQKIYINNLEDGSGTSDSALNTSNTDINYLGVRTGTANYFSGRQEAFGYWSRVLTSDERTSWHNGGSGLDYPFTTGTNAQINIGDEWVAIDAMQINIGDTWKAVAGAQVNIGDTWKDIF